MCILHECSICFHHKRNVILCKWDKCTYQICYRCHYLYGRGKPCPACRRDSAFIKPTGAAFDMMVFTKHKCIIYYDKYKRWINCVKHFIIIPYCIINIMAAFGVFVIKILQLYKCCVTYFEFLYMGVLACIVVLCIFLFINGICHHSDD